MFSMHVLRYQKNPISRDTLRRHYMEWRKSQGIPVRCDEPVCIFYSEPLVWNGKPLKPILDHSNGNNTDNRVSNLRFLCPNCDSQLVETRGGANKGRIEKSEGGFALVSKKEKKREYILPPEAGHLGLSGNPARLIVKKRKPYIQ